MRREQHARSHEMQQPQWHDQWLRANAALHIPTNTPAQPRPRPSLRIRRGALRGQKEPTEHPRSRGGQTVRYSMDETRASGYARSNTSSSGMHHLGGMAR